MDETDKIKLKKSMDDTDKIKLKKSMDDTDKIKLKDCTVTKDGVFCNMDQENHQKMIEQKIIPNDLTINLEKETSKNKSTDGTQSTKADSSNKQECECSKTTDYSEIANFVAKYLQNEEN